MQKNNKVMDRSSLEQVINNARRTLAALMIFTVINMVLLFIGSETYFLFSATVPYYLAAFGQIFSEMFGIPALYVVANAIGLIILAVYFVLWLVSKKHPAALIAVLVFFALDFVVLFGLIAWTEAWADSLFDLVFHAIVLFSLISGVSALARIKKLPPEQAQSAAQSAVQNAEQSGIQSTQQSILDVDPNQIKES